MPYKKTKIEKIHYSIGEVADMTGISTSSIRYWENNFCDLSPGRNNKGTRFFTSENIETIRLISYLVKERGLTIKGAQQKLKDNRQDTVNNWEIIKKLRKIKKTLCEIRDEMKETPDEDQ